MPRENLRGPYPVTSKHGSIKFLFFKTLILGEETYEHHFSLSPFLPWFCLFFLLQCTSPHLIYNKIFITESYLERINFGDLLSRRDN